MGSESAPELLKRSVSHHVPPIGTLRRLRRLTRVLAKIAYVRRMRYEISAAP